VLASSNTAAGIGALIGFLIIASLYMLPTIIGWQRKVVNIGSVAAINLLLGWTLIGWAVALAMALRTNPPHAYDQYWQNQHHQSYWSRQESHAPPGWYPVGDKVRYWDGQHWGEERSPGA